MEKKLVFFNETAYNAQIDSLKEKADQCQEIIDKFNSLKIGEFQPDDLFDLLFKTENYLFEKTMKDQPLVVNGMKFSKQNFYDLMEKPEAYQELIKMVQLFLLGVEEAINKLETSILKENYINFFEIVKKVRIKDTTKISLKEQHKVYAHSEAAQLLAEFQQKFVDLINETDIFNKAKISLHGMRQIELFFPSLIKLDFSTGAAAINPSAITRIDRN